VTPGLGGNTAETRIIMVMWQEGQF